MANESARTDLHVSAAQTDDVMLFTCAATQTHLRADPAHPATAAGQNRHELMSDQRPDGGFGSRDLLVVIATKLSHPPV